MIEVKVMIVDDHKILRDGIRSHFENKSTEFKVVAEAADGSEAISQVKKTPIDVVLLDINMEGMNGIECAEILLEKYSNIKILMLTMLSEPLHVKKLIGMGVHGYLLKSSDEEEIFKAIRDVMKGENYYGNEVTKIVMNSLNNKGNKTSKFSMDIPLTKREKEVLKLVVEEFSNQEISNMLSISPRTVDAHKRNLLEKTRSKNIAGLVIYAINKGII